MIIILSPAKIQNFSPQETPIEPTLPLFLAQAQELIDLLREFSTEDLAKLLGVNLQLARLNFERTFNWSVPFNKTNAKLAVLTYDGEVYRGLNAASFTQMDFEYAQQHLRLLSGLYGYLRPLDLIQAYRLEVSSKISNPHGKDLYAYWKNKVTQQLTADLKKSGKNPTIINLASSEYNKVIDYKKFNLKKIDIEFYQYVNDQYKQIVVYTKKARGLMARYIIQNRIEDVEDLKGFDAEGYWFTPQLSTEEKLVFVR